MATVIAYLISSRLERTLLKKFLQHTKLEPGTKIRGFEEPKNALKFLRSKTTKEATRIVFFLSYQGTDQFDIWEMIKEIPEELFKPRKVEIFIISSSVDWDDVTKARTNDRVKGYITKPVTNVEIEIALNHTKTRKYYFFR